LGTAYPITCAAPSYLARAGVPEIPEKIADHRCVNFVLPQSGREINWKFQVEDKPLVLPVSSYLLFDYAEALLEAAVGGAGLIQAPQYIVARAIQRGELVPVLTPYASREGTMIAIVYPQKKYRSAKLGVFIEFMTALMADLRREGIVD
jgi:LysR family transcriptional regulator, regulator for bpeEF and oprC